MGGVCQELKGADQFGHLRSSMATLGDSLSQSALLRFQLHKLHATRCIGANLRTVHWQLAALSLAKCLARTAKICQNTCLKPEAEGSFERNFGMGTVHSERLSPNSSREQYTRRSAMPMLSLASSNEDGGTGWFVEGSCRFRAGIATGGHRYWRPSLGGWRAKRFKNVSPRNMFFHVSEGSRSSGSFTRFA